MKYLLQLEVWGKTVGAVFFWENSIWGTTHTDARLREEILKSFIGNEHLKWKSNIEARAREILNVNANGPTVGHKIQMVPKKVNKGSFQKKDQIIKYYILVQALHIKGSFCDFFTILTWSVIIIIQKSIEYCWIVYWKCKKHMLATQEKT